MDGGYYTLLLIKIDLWSRVVCPLTLVHGAWMGLVVGLVDLMFGYFVCIYLSKKPFFLVGYLTSAAFYEMFSVLQVPSEVY